MLSYYSNAELMKDNLVLNLKEKKDIFLEYLLPLKKQLYNFIQKSLNYSDNTSDLYQDTLLKAFNYFESFQQDRSFKTWIFSIAHNKIKDFYRFKKKKDIIQDHLLELDNSGSVPDETVMDIYKAAAEIKPRYRKIFFLYYYNAFSINEISKITGLTNSNIKFRLFQSRKILRNKLGVKE